MSGLQWHSVRWLRGVKSSWRGKRELHLTPESSPCWRWEASAQQPFSSFGVWMGEKWSRQTRIFTEKNMEGNFFFFAPTVPWQCCEVKVLTEHGVRHNLRWRGHNASTHPSTQPLKCAHLISLEDIYSPSLSLLAHLRWLITSSSFSDNSPHSGERSSPPLLRLSVSFYHSLLHSSQFNSNSILPALHLLSLLQRPCATPSKRKKN